MANPLRSSRVARRAAPAPAVAAFCAGLFACTGFVSGDRFDDDPATAHGGSTAAGRGGSAGGRGAGSTGSSSGGSAAGPTFACTPAASPPASSLRKLTNTQLRNTLRDLAAFAVGDVNGGVAIMSEIAPSLDRLPADVRAAVPEDLSGAYRRMDQTLQQIHVDGAYAVSAAFASALTSPARVAKVVGTCATDADASNDAACIDAFIRKLGSRALRRPLTADDVAFYRRAYRDAAPGVDPAALADVVALMLDSPGFLYHVEAGATEVKDHPGTWQLGAYELAARLSYQFWDSLPDDQLWAVAESGKLLDEAEYGRQVDRLVADARARDTLARFYADWLKVEDLPRLDLHASEPLYKAFAADATPSRELRDAMVNEVVDLASHVTWTAKGKLSDLLTTELGFPRTAELAKIYGVPVWDGRSAPPTLQPAGSRPGFLTRARFLADDTPNTRPVLKGVFIRRHVLCDVLPPPPDNAASNPPEVSTDQSTRDVVTQLTEKAGTTCASCHKRYINALGFVTESFDALGRLRSEQRLFDASGRETKRVPVDTRAVPAVVEGDPREATNARDLMSLVAESGKVEACLARAYFHFSFARWDDEERDGCALEPLRQSLAAGQTLIDFLWAVAFVPAFKQRTL